MTTKIKPNNDYLYINERKLEEELVKSLYKKKQNDYTSVYAVTSLVLFALFSIWLLCIPQAQNAGFESIHNNVEVSK